MSVIISGESCVSCKKSFWVSLGHPKWYDDVIKRGMPKNENYLRLEKIAKSGKCPECYGNSKLN